MGVSKGAGVAVALTSMTTPSVAEAMGQALQDVFNETKLIADSDLPPEEKQKQIAALNDPDTVRQRMMDARAKAKALRREFEYRNSPAGHIEALKKASNIT